MNSLDIASKRTQRMMLPTASLWHADGSIAVGYQRPVFFKRSASRRGAEFARSGSST